MLSPAGLRCGTERVAAVLRGSALLRSAMFWFFYFILFVFAIIVIIVIVVIIVFIIYGEAVPCPSVPVPLSGAHRRLCCLLESPPHPRTFGEL